MRANIGFILIGLGLVGAYVALGGKFGKGTAALSSNGQEAIPKTADSIGIANMGTTQPGGASQPANAPFIPSPGSTSPGETPKDPTTNAPVGSGGMSIQSRWTQLGHVLALHPMDRYASRGGFQ